MKLCVALILLAVVCCCSCESSNSPSKAAPVLADTANFYPLATFFKSQSEYVDLRDFNIYRVSIIDGKKDSVKMSKDEFINWADIFRQRSFADPAEKALYKENVFQDESTGSYTLNYTPHDPAAVTVKNIDVLLDQETKNVKRVFFKSTYNRGDTTIEEQCSWKTDKSFQINRSKHTGKGYNSTELNYINWNDR